MMFLDFITLIGNSVDLYWAFGIILQIPELKEIILLGFYQSSEILSKFITSAQQEFNVPIRYLNINNY